MKIYRVELKASGVRFKHTIVDPELRRQFKDCVSTGTGRISIPKDAAQHYTVDERFTGLGPYCGTHDLPANITRWLREVGGLTVDPSFFYDDNQHPDPYDDMLLRRNIKERREFTGALSSMFYGFASLKSLDCWFDSYIRRDLHDAGYIIMVYEAEEAYEGTAQAVFNRNTATPIDIIHLHEFPDLEEAIS